MIYLLCFTAVFVIFKFELFIIIVVCRKHVLLSRGVDKLTYFVTAR